MTIIGSNKQFEISIDKVAEILYNLVNEKNAFEYLVIHINKTSWEDILTQDDRRSESCVRSYRELARLFIMAQTEIANVKG